MNEVNGVSAEGKDQRTLLPLILGGVLILAVSVGLYVHTTDFKLVFDDEHIITYNASIQVLKDDPWKIFDLYTQEFWEGAHKGTAQEYLRPANQALYRPMMMTWLGLIFMISDDDPAWYHAGNILLNALVCLVAFLLVSRLFGSTRFGLFSGLLFACHPIHTEAVCYVTGSGELLGALFFLLAFLFYLKASYDRPSSEGSRFRIVPYVLSLLFFAIGLFSKEHVITLVGVLVVYDLIRALSGKGTLGLFPRIGLYLGYGAVIGLNLLARLSAIGTLTPGKQNPVDNVIAMAIDYDRQLFTALKVLLKGIWMTIYPVNLSPDYSFRAISLSKSLMEKEVIAAVVFIALLLIIALVSIRKWPALSFGILWHFITIFLVSNLVIVVGTIFGERLLYLPSLGFCMVAGFLLDRLCMVDARKDEHFGRIGTTIAGALLVLAAGAYGYKAHHETGKWENSDRLWAEAEEVAGSSAKVHFQLGQIYARNKIFPEAEKHFQKAVNIEQSFLMARISLAQCLLAQGGDPQKVERAKMNLELIRGVSKDLDPALEAMVTGLLAKLYMASPDTSERAIDELLKLKEKDNTVELNLSIGDTHLRNKAIDKALAAYREAWDLDPERFDAAYRMLAVYGQSGRTQEEAELLTRLEKEDTKTSRAFMYRAQLNLKNSEPEMAKEALDKAIERAPDQPRPYLVKAGLLKSEYRYDEALKLLDRVLAKDATPQIEAEVLLTKLDIFIQKDDAENAKATVDRIERLPQQPPVVKASLGTYYLAQKDHERAAQFLREAVGGGMRTLANYSALAQALSALERYEEIVSVLGPAVEDMKILDVEILRILGGAQIETGDFEKGVVTLRECLNQGGRNPWIQFQVAYGDVKLGNYGTAWTLFDKIEEGGDAPQQLKPFIGLLRARILLDDESRKDPAKALEMAQGLAAGPLASRDGSFAFILARALKANGKTAEAKTVAEKALKKFPEHKELTGFLESLGE